MNDLIHSEGIPTECNGMSVYGEKKPAHINTSGFYVVSGECIECKIWKNSITNAKNNPKIGNPTGLSRSEKNKLPIHYLYHHLDSDGTVVYVGIGSNGRGYEYIIRRQKDHGEWALQEQLDGRTMSEITKIITSNQVRKVVADLEKEHIRKYNPIFNK